MHTYVVVRGIIHEQERFIKELSSQYIPAWKKNSKGEFIPMKTIDPETGEGDQSLMQVSVRPIQLYEIVHHEPELNRVLAMIRPAKKYREKYKWMAWIVEKLGKIMGLEKVPEVEEFKGIPQCYKNKHVVCEVVGIKRDEYNDEGMEQL